MAMFYALSDSFTGDNPSDYTSGFANSTEVICFQSKADRDEWVRSTKLLPARAIARKEALQRLAWQDGQYLVYTDGHPHTRDVVKVARVYNNCCIDGLYYHILQIKKEA